MKAPLTEFQLAQGMTWLMQYIEGKPIVHIARDVGHSHVTVRKYMLKAAGMMTEAAKEKVLETLIPLAIKVFQKELEKELEAVEKGETPKTRHADRLLKGMYVLDAPLPKTPTHQPTEDDGDGQVELTAVLKKKLRSSPVPSLPPAIEGKMLEGKVVESGRDEDKAAVQSDDSGYPVHIGGKDE